MKRYKGDIRLKIFLLTLLVSFLIISMSCSEAEDELSESDIFELDIPPDFDYEMSHSVLLNLSGAYRLPLTIKTLENKVLFKAQMNPETGIITSLLLPKTVSKLIVAYGREEITLNITDSTLSYDFSQAR